MKHARDDYNDLAALDKRIPDDEPVFLIRGQDAAGPMAVRAWADIAEKLGADPKIVMAALDHSYAMEEWQASVGRRKVPDMP